MTIMEGPVRENIAAAAETEKPILNYTTMRLSDKAQMWRDLRGFCEDPCSAILGDSLQRGMYDEDWRKERHRRRTARAKLNAELRSGGAQR